MIASQYDPKSRECSRQHPDRYEQDIPDKIAIVVMVLN